MYRMLYEDFNEEDVKNALYDIEETKAPGSDGYSSCFFKKAWPQIGRNISAAILNFFRTGKLLKQVNATSLCLVPKMDQPPYVTQYRPVGCCNVLHKIISKMLLEVEEGIS